MFPLELGVGVVDWSFGFIFAAFVVELLGSVDGIAVADASLDSGTFLSLQ